MNRDNDIKIVTQIFDNIKVHSVKDVLSDSDESETSGSEDEKTDMTKIKNNAFKKDAKDSSSSSDSDEED